MSDLPSAWHSRGYLPHYDDRVAVQAVTYRLADALPASVVAGLREQAQDDARHREAVERYLDAGHGSCLLGDPANASLVVAAWQFFDTTRYRLHAWCIMPNHVHVLFEPLAGNSVQMILQSQKSYTAKAILQRLRGVCGPQAAHRGGSSRHVWQAEYFDRFIRSDAHYLATITYIHENPVKAGLVGRAAYWPSSSAALWLARKNAVAGQRPALPGPPTWIVSREIPRCSRDPDESAPTLPAGGPRCQPTPSTA